MGNLLLVAKITKTPFSDSFALVGKWLLHFNSALGKMLGDWEGPGSVTSSGRLS